MKQFGSRTAITVSLFIFLTFFTIGPLITLVLTSFNGSNTGLFEGKFSLNVSSYISIFKTAYDLKAFWDTLILSLGVSTLSLAISLPVSYGLSWTDMPLKKFIRTTQMMGLGIPGFIVSLVMIVFTGSIFRSDLHVHTFWGLLVALSLSSVPFQVLYSTLSFERLDYRLIEAAKANGIGSLRTLFMVTIPLLIPGIMSGFIVVFLLTTGSLSVPLLLAPPSFPLLAPLAYSELLSFFNWSLASSDLMLIFLVNIVAVLFYVRLSKRIPKTVSGKGFRTRRNSSRLVRYGLVAYSLIFVAIFLGEIFIVGGYAFGKRWAGTPLPSGFTVSYFTSGLSLYQFSPFSTILMGSGAGIIAVLLTLSITYGNRTGSVGGSTYMNFLILTVFSLSNTIIGISYLSMFSNQATGFLINSVPVVLLLGYIFARLGYAANSVRLSVDSLSDSIIQSSRLMVSQDRSPFFRVILPLVLPGLLEGFLLVFVRSAIDYGSTVFLAPISWTTLSLSSYSFIITGELGQGAALSLIILAITMPVSYYLYRLRSRNTV
jgi:iron(III) transport system permease protein